MKYMLWSTLDDPESELLADQVIGIFDSPADAFVAARELLKREGVTGHQVQTLDGNLRIVEFSENEQIDTTWYYVIPIKVGKIRGEES